MPSAYMFAYKHSSMLFCSFDAEELKSSTGSGSCWSSLLCGISFTCLLQKTHRTSRLPRAPARFLSFPVMADWSWVAYTALEALVAAACCLGNVLVVCAVCVGIRDSLREPTFCFLVSLAVADLLVGAAAVPLAVLLDGWASLTPDLCLLLSCVVLVLTQASVLSLLCIAVDRYLRLHTPLRYKALATQRRTWLAVCVCWMLSCLLGFTPLFGWRNPSSYNSTNSSSSPSTCTFLSVVSLSFMVYFNFLGCVMAPLLVMILLYARLFWSLQRRLKESYPQTRAPLLRERRLACSLALVLVLFAICWIPLHLINCLLLFYGPQAVTQSTLYAGILLSHANSAVNPVVYACRIPKIRQAYRQIWRPVFVRLSCCHRDKQVQQSIAGRQANHTEARGPGGESNRIRI